MSTPQSGTKRILVIDDEPHVVRYLETLLQDSGYETMSAADGDEGMTKAREAKPDLVCLDISMPEKSGMRVLKELANDSSIGRVPVVVITAVTGYGRDSEQFKKFMDGRSQFPPPEAFIAKPIKPEEFLETIARVLSA